MDDYSIFITGNVTFVRRIKPFVLKRIDFLYSFSTVKPMYCHDKRMRETVSDILGKDQFL